MEDRVLYLHHFRVRVKDQKGKGQVKEVTQQFVSDRPNEPKAFDKFVAQHSNVLCRYYRSINGRLESRVKKDLVCELVANDHLRVERVADKLAKYTANDGKDCVTRKWLFDFDSRDQEAFNQFYQDLLETSQLTKDQTWVYPTPNGYHVAVDHGFKDVDKLVARHAPTLEFKRTSGFLLLDYRLKEV